MKVLANRKLEFSNGIDTATTKMGICELPDWVEKTPFFQMAQLDKSITVFVSGSDKEVAKVEEENKKLKAQIDKLKKENGDTAAETGK